ncbi:hypothetical protein KC327_g64 [Hortaea werneckii]|nr:hypothetical protein KC327_g64 [Hortaea werneckii]
MGCIVACGVKRLYQLFVEAILMRTVEWYLGRRGKGDEKIIAGNAGISMWFRRLVKHILSRSAVLRHGYESDDHESVPGAIRMRLKTSRTSLRRSWGSLEAARPKTINGDSCLSHLNVRSNPGLYGVLIYHPALDASMM